jgi:hypothetical protein
VVVTLGALAGTSYVVTIPDLAELWRGGPEAFWQRGPVSTLFLQRDNEWRAVLYQQTVLDA